MYTKLNESIQQIDQKKLGGLNTKKVGGPKNRVGQ